MPGRHGVHRPTQRLRLRLRLRTLILLVPLIPMTGMALMVATSARTALDARQSAMAARDSATGLVDIVDARLAVTEEQLVSTALALASSLGAGIDEVSEFLGVDYRAKLARARGVVDRNAVLAKIHLDAVGLPALRSRVDQGTADPDDVTELFDSIEAVLDSSWEVRLSLVEQRGSGNTLPGALPERIRTTDEAFQSLRAGAIEANLLGHLAADEASAANLAGIAAAHSRYEASIQELSGRLGPEAARAWQVHRADAAARRFEQLRQRVNDAVLTDAISTLGTDTIAFATSVAEAVPWSATLAETVRAGGRDLRAEGAAQAKAATGALRDLVGLSALLMLVSAFGSVMLARSVALPVRRLAAAAHRIEEGEFDLPPINPTGARELAATVRAFNDMTRTLAAVEHQAIALAEDPQASATGDFLPGRTGQALDVTMSRLRATMQLAERQRQTLEEAATHDGLTGLLNRRAAVEMVARDISLLARTGGQELALFIDLDQLKSINDSYGHAAGDDAIRLTADALRMTTRDSDIVARLGGDEFLVAGMVATDAEVGLLAARILTAVSEQRLLVPSGSVPLRCSIGIALSSPDHLSADRLIGDADTAMYDAKHAGGGRVAWHPDSRPSALSG